MQLKLSQISSITTGAVRITEESDGFHFYRFTREQELMYQARNAYFYGRSFGTAGVRFRFRTDSRRMELKFLISSGETRSFFAVDITVNGTVVDGIDNYSQTAPEENYGDLKYDYGVYCAQVQLGAGEKEVCIELPWSVKAVLQELSLDDGATLIPVSPEKKALCFGDSITQGADAMRPVNRYISKFCDFLGASEWCKAICGERFWPELALTKEPFQPDYITVAYGTNDWSKTEPEELIRNCLAFFRNLKDNYPNAKLIAVSPVWRADYLEKNRAMPLAQVHDIICEAVKDNANAVVIHGLDLVPQDCGFFGDLRLHPNDAGFAHYFRNLAARYAELSK